jgi:hypothetical protein
MNYKQTLLCLSHHCIANLANKETQILDTDPALHFALLRLQLIELIRTCTSSTSSDITPALNFASSQLAPRAATNSDFLSDLELTMSLLIFLPATGTLQKELTDLLEPSLRRNVASKVNEAILTSMGARGEARMRSLVRLRHWAETTYHQCYRWVCRMQLRDQWIASEAMAKRLMSWYSRLVSAVGASRPSH